MVPLASLVALIGPELCFRVPVLVSTVYSLPAEGFAGNDLQAPRAKIFRRDEGDAASLGGMQGLMRSNNWRRDSVHYSGFSCCPS